MMTSDEIIDASNIVAKTEASKHYDKTSAYMSWLEVYLDSFNDSVEVLAATNQLGRVIS